MSGRESQTCSQMKLIINFNITSCNFGSPWTGGPKRCGPEFNEMADCSQPTHYGHMYWITRAPREVFPYTNLLRIFNTPSWLLLLFSLLLVTLFLIVAAKLGTHYGVGTDDWWNVAFVPFRSAVIQVQKMKGLPSHKT